MPGTRKLGRPTDQRMAMLKGLVTFLLENGRVETTLTRAKEVSSLTDKMITLAKHNTLASYRQALSFITKEDVAHELFSVTVHKFDKRAGGYTRIYKLGPRRGDGAEMALIELVGVTEELNAPKKKAAPKKAAAKKQAAADKAAETAAAEEVAAIEDIKEQAAETVAKAAKAKSDKVESAVDEAAEVVEEAAEEAAEVVEEAAEVVEEAAEEAAEESKGE